MTTPLDRMADFDLSDEQRQVRASVREFAEKEILPYVEQYEREERYPLELIAKLPPLGLHGAHDPRGVRRLVLGRPHLRDHLRGAGAGRLGDRLGGLGLQLPGGRLDPPLRRRGAEAALAARHGSGRDPLLGVPHRAGRRHRPRQHAHHGHAGGRRLPAERHQGLHLARRPRRPLLRGGERRPREEAQGRDGLPRRPAQHEGHHPRRLPDADPQA